MKTIQQIECTDGTWLFLAPIRNLEIERAVNYEFTVNLVTFVNSSRFMERRKRYGFKHPISEINTKYKALLDKLLREEKTFATLRLTGKGTDIKNKFIKQINDELSIISLSQLGYSRRSHNCSPDLTLEKRTLWLRDNPGVFKCHGTSVL